jgi:hypothetical protein
MASQISISTEEGLEIIALANGAEDYCLWQVEDDRDEIYFEFDDQINGGHDLVRECTLMFDGMHIVLSSGQLYHFYFDAVSVDDYRKLVAFLENIYPKNVGILDVIDR